MGQTLDHGKDSVEKLLDTTTGMAINLARLLTLNDLFFVTVVTLFGQRFVFSISPFL